MHFSFQIVSGCYHFCNCFLNAFLLIPTNMGNLVELRTFDLTSCVLAVFLFNVSQVVTFWEGEIVDTKNYTFYTGKWEASYVSFCRSLLFFLFNNGPFFIKSMICNSLHGKLENWLNSFPPFEQAWGW